MAETEYDRVLSFWKEEGYLPQIKPEHLQELIDGATECSPFELALRDRQDVLIRSEAEVW